MSKRNVTIASVLDVSIGFTGCEHPKNVDILLPIEVFGEWDKSLSMASWFVDHGEGPSLLRFTGTHYPDSKLLTCIVRDWVKGLTRDLIEEQEVPIKDYGHLTDMVASQMLRVAKTTKRGDLWLLNQFHEFM